jgi:hypothetical protein
MCVRWVLGNRHSRGGQSLACTAQLLFVTTVDLFWSLSLCSVAAVATLRFSKIKVKVIGSALAVMWPCVEVLVAGAVASQWPFTGHLPRIECCAISG